MTSAYREVPFVSIADAAGATNLVVLAPSLDWTPPPLNMTGSVADVPTLSARPPSCPQYRAELHDVAVVAGLNLVLNDAHQQVVCDTLAGDVSDLYFSWYHRYGVRLSDEGFHTVFAGSDTRLAFDNALSFFSWTNDNYAHWLTEKLARFHWIDQIALPSDTVLLVEAGLPQSIMESLALFWPPDRTVCVPKGGRVAVSCLHYFSDAAQLRELRPGRPLDGNEYLVFPPALAWLGRQVKARLEVAARPDAEKSYLLRGFSLNGRNVLNQAECAEALAGAGFACFDPGTLDFREQVSRLASSRLLVSSSGAALANLLWMPRGSVVLVLIQETREALYWFFHSLAAAVGVRLHYLPADGVKTRQISRPHWDLSVRIDALLETVRSPLCVAGRGLPDDAAHAPSALLDWMATHRPTADGAAHHALAPSIAVPGNAAALPRVTVAVMSYNNARFIEKTIRSVLDQKGIELDVVVFDDCSTDDSVVLLQAFEADPRFTLHVNPVNLGMTRNYNRCLDSGRGDFVVVLGSDDVLYPGHLATLATALRFFPQAPLAYTQCWWIDEADKFIECASHRGHLGYPYYGGRDEVVDLLRFDNYITPSAVMMRRACYDAFRLPGGEIHRLDLLAGDWELWTRIARTLPDFIYLRQATIGYRIHGGQISAGFYKSDRPLAEHTEILELNLADDAVLPRVQAAAADVWALYQQRLGGYPPETRARFDERSERIRQKLFSLPRMDMDGPFFTVVLTTFNRPQLLADALASLVHQSFRDFEVVLVNDHGMPVETVMHSVDLPITYLYQGANRGLSAARNAALRLARGRYVVYLDDDDLYAPRHLEVLAAAHREHPDAVVYTGVTYVHERLEDGRREELGRHEPFTHSTFSRERLFVQNYIPVNTWSHPRAAVDAASGFDTSLTALEDWDMLLRLAATHSFVHVQDSTAEVHIRTSSTQPDDHMLGREGKNFPALYRRLYHRHGHLGDDTVRAQQEAFLAKLAQQEPVELTPSQRLLRWQDARVPLQSEGRLIDAHLQAAGGGPRILVLVRDVGGDDEKLATTVGSLRFGHNLYEPVSVVVLTGDARASGAATMPTDRVHLVGADPHSIDAANEVIVRSDADWCLVVDSGVEFTRSGLLMMALEVLQAPDCRALYGDELRRMPDGSVGAAFRPGVNLDYLLSFPASMAGHWLVRKDAFVQAGGFDPAYEDAAGFDLLLRLIGQDGLGSLRHVAEPLLMTDTPGLASSPRLREAIERHLLGRGYLEAQVSEPLPGRYRIRYGHAAQPRVSIIACCLGGVALLQRCVESVLEKTLYGKYEILIADATVSPDAETKAWLSGIEAMGSPDLRIVRCSGDSVAEAANRAAQTARGDYLCFLDDECAVIQADWLDGLLNHALRPEVGVVGAKLLRADGTVRSALCVLGLEGPVGSAFHGASLDEGGYMHRLEVDQNASAVDGACMVVRAEAFRAAGGFSDAAGDGSYKAADLCLSIAASGYLVVWTPHVLMLCDGGVADASAASASARTLAAEALYAKWLPQLARDPAYNRNLSLRGSGFSLEPNAALNWDPLPWRPLPVVLALPADHGGCGHYRIIKPFQAMKAGGVIDGMLSADFFTPIELERYGADAIVFQRQLTDLQLDNMQGVRQFNRIFKIYELDDYLPNLPVKSVHKKDIGQDVIKTLRRGLGYVDRFVVSTEMLAESFAGLHRDIRVVQNRLPPEWWAGLSSRRQRGRLPRVGWAGGAGHTGDLELVADVVKALASEVEWVFMGLCPDKLRPYVHEVHAGVPIDAYPRALAALDLDLAIAPLEQNLFNECKSNLRLLEYGACGFPVVCSDIACYRGDLPVTRVKNRFKDWVEAIRMHTADLQAAAQSGDALRAQVYRDWMLEGPHLVDWRNAWTGR